MENFWQIWIPIISVILSGSIAIAVARIQTIATTKKLDREFRQKTTDSLFQKRISAYPQLSEIVVPITKMRFTQGITESDLANMIKAFDAWEIKNSIFLSPLGSGVNQQSKKRIWYYPR